MSKNKFKTIKQAAKYYRICLETIHMQAKIRKMGDDKDWKELKEFTESDPDLTFWGCENLWDFATSLEKTLSAEGIVNEKSIRDLTKPQIQRLAAIAYFG